MTERPNSDRKHYRKTRVRWNLCLCFDFLYNLNGQKIPFAFGVNASLD